MKTRAQAIKALRARGEAIEPNDVCEAMIQKERRKPMQTVKLKWCNWCGQFVDRFNNSEHKLTRCEVVVVEIPKAVQS